MTISARHFFDRARKVDGTSLLPKLLLQSDAARLKERKVVDLVGGGTGLTAGGVSWSKA
jgi:hypothetical protein